MVEESKDKIIRGVYYDADGGFGSISEAYKKKHTSYTQYNNNK